MNNKNVMNQIECVNDVLQHDGYIVRAKNDQNASLYNNKGDFVRYVPLATMERESQNHQNAHWHDCYGGEYVARNLGELHFKHENLEHCRSIANDADNYATGRVYRCLCGETLTIPDDCERYCCPYCGETSDVDKLEQQNMWDFMSDSLDIEFVVDKYKALRSAKIMVAWGGPNIYLDTASGDVELYWGSHRARYFMSHEAIEAIDDWAQECWDCL